MRNKFAVTGLLVLLIWLYAGLISPWLVKSGYQHDFQDSPRPQISECINQDNQSFSISSEESSITANLRGAAGMVFHQAAPWLRNWRTGWGATDHDKQRYLPGDELVPEPEWDYTHAITINAPHVAIWPWIVQIGQKRGGFYSYQVLENIIGCQISNADQIIDRYQFLRPGDEIYLHPQAPPLKVRSLRRNYWFVLNGGELIAANQPAGSDNSANLTWTFYLQKIDSTTTKLITRGRYAYGPGLANSLSYGPYLIEPIAFVMERKMLRGIKRRAENHLCNK